MTRFIETHKRNVAWVNEQIRICVMARRLLKGHKQSSYAWLIQHSDCNGHPELAPLKEAIAKHRESWNLRFGSYNLALIRDIFDLRHFVYQARTLKWKEQEYVSLKA
jgi:hypothetical protein